MAEVGDRVFVDVYGKPGVVLSWDSSQYKVRLYDDPQYVVRWVNFWEIESIKPHEWGEDPELDKRVETGLELVDGLLNQHMPSEATRTRRSQAKLEKEGEDG